MRRLVYYSLALPRDHERADLLWQLEASVRSLRGGNSSIPVILFLYGELPLDRRRSLERLGVHVWPSGSYEQKLASLAPRGWQALAQYPLLHKFLNFPAIDTLDPLQVLFLDCDTIFAGDVEELFERYAEADCCAREEPTCARSHYGYDPGYVDESALAAIAASQGVRVPPPFNLGIVLWNQAAWRRVPALDALFVRYVWRFLVGLVMQGPTHRSAAYGENPAARFLAAHHTQLLTDEDVDAALPYASANGWILDQMGLWFTLGHLHGLRYADFTRAHVLQNGEFSSPFGQRRDWIACHYFSQNLERMDQWIRQQAAARPRAS